MLINAQEQCLKEKLLILQLKQTNYFRRVPGMTFFWVN